MSATADQPIVATADVVAEAIVLCAFDTRRTIAGHDFGGGQRRQELNRRIDALRGDDSRVFTDWMLAGRDHAGRVEEARAELVDPARLRAALIRVGGPRVRRLRRETHRWGTKANDRAMHAWRETARLFDVPFSRLTEAE